MVNKPHLGCGKNRVGVGIGKVRDVCKRIFFILMVLLSVLGLCACSAKPNKTVSLNGNEEKYSTASNDEIRNEKTDDSSHADPRATTLNVSLEEKRIIHDQSFNVELNAWGNVRFISYEPDNSIDFEDVSIFLIKDNHVIYSFPYYRENNSTENYVGLFDSMAAVAFSNIIHHDLDFNPIVSPAITLVSYPILVCSRMSSSMTAMSFSRNSNTVEPPNLKYPFSSPLLILFP